MLYTPRPSICRLLLATVTILVGNFPKCYALKNPFYGLTLHGSIGLGVSEPKTSSSTSYPHYHYPFGPYHASKARYPSPSINQDGRYTHLLQLSRSRRDDSSNNIMGYRPIKHYEKSNYENGLDFLIHMLGGGERASKLHNGHHPRVNLSSPEFGQMSHPRPGRVSFGPHTNQDRRDYHPSPFHHSPVYPELTRLVNPFVSHGPSEHPDNHFPSIYQHPLLQIVPLLVIEKRHRIKPGHGPPSPTHPPLSPPFDHPHHYQPPHRLRHSKINFPVDDVPPHMRFTTSKFPLFPTSSLGNVNQIQNSPASVPPHIRQFLVQDPFPQNGVGSIRFPRQKNIFRTATFESNNNLEPNYDGGPDYPDIITANQVTPQMKFPVESSFDIGGNNMQFAQPSFRNSHQYSPTTGPDQDLLRLSPLLMGSESKRITDKVSNSTVESIPIKIDTEETTIERRYDDNTVKADKEKELKNRQVWVNGKHVKIPNFTPMPTLHI